MSVAWPNGVQLVFLFCSRFSVRFEPYVYLSSCGLVTACWGWLLARLEVCFLSEGAWL